MSKLKTKSGAKKRFKISANGKIMFQKTRKQHNMRKRPSDMLRQARGMQALSESMVPKVKRHMLPNGL